MNSPELSAFAKDIIKECFEHNISLAKTYVAVNTFCPKKHYTMERVGKYLRKIRKDKEREKATLDYLEASAK